MGWDPEKKMWTRDREKVVCSQCRKPGERVGVATHQLHYPWEFRCEHCGSQDCHCLSEACPECAGMLVHKEQGEALFDVQQCKHCQLQVVRPVRPRDRRTKLDPLGYRRVDLSGDPSEEYASRLFSALVRLPTGHGVEVARDVATNLPHLRVAETIAEFPDGVTFGRLKSQLARRYLKSSLRSKYLREYVERCIAEGLITSKVGQDGLARYYRLYVPKNEDR